ncbi:hypothetical protein V1358_16565 [Pseudoalteromonas sp. YIC-656]|uniref:hypothetical protein n=1 Tax=Pseudoalteromonas pernae TaxID=3118054 RepID=UPI003242EA99
MRLLIALMAIVFSTSLAHARNIDVSGMWLGSYQYDSAPSRVPVITAMVIEQNGQSLSARMIEENTSQNPKLVGRPSRLTGFINGKSITLLKTYDDGAESIEYRFEVSVIDGNKQIQGTWQLANMTGSAEYMQIKF